MKGDDLDAKGRYIQISNVDLWREMNWLKRVRLRTPSNRIGSVLLYWPDERQSNFRNDFAASDSVGSTTDRLTVLLILIAKLCRTEKSLKLYELQVSLYRVSGHDRSHGLSRTMQIFYAITVPYSETR